MYGTINDTHDNTLLFCGTYAICYITLPDKQINI